MKISKDQAVELASEHIRIITTTYFENCEPLENLPAGTSYLPNGWKLSDYWLIPFPDFMNTRTLHTGGNSVFLTISKTTGEVSTVTVQGE
jgi:hypothetical protein